ncbi:MAG TPA: hypothetical protein VM470_04070 [Acidimicrobiia bacterium]|nr:hypothetical protein [Acidimicrobiia bacterium]
MAEIPESLLRRSAEAKAKALGRPVEQVLAEMKGEVPEQELPEPEVLEADESREAPDASEEVPEEELVSVTAATATTSEPEPRAPSPESSAPEAPTEPEAETLTEPAGPTDPGPEAPTAPETGNGSTGNGKRASTVTPRPVVPPAGVPEGVRTQRLLTVVKARAIQQVKSEPTDKVNTWPHLVIGELTALMAVTGLLLVLSVILQAPLLDPANSNATPNPSKAPWYFLGLQELLSYFDPQIAGVAVPLIVGLLGFMMIPYIDKNPSTRPADRKFAIMLYTLFLAGSATLTIFGVLFRGLGFNFAYPWQDGIFFDDIKDWVFFE